MSSTLIKTLFAGAIAAGALLLPGTAAQAAGNHHPCDGPGFGDGGFFGDHFGFPGDDFGFPGDGFFGDDFGFHHRRPEAPTVIVVTVNNKHRHHKPMPTGNAAGAGGYHKPSHSGHGNGHGNGGYRKSA